MMVAIKSMLANSTMMVRAGSMVAERIMRSEPVKQLGESLAVVEMAEQSMAVGSSMMGEWFESSDRGSKWWWHPGGMGIKFPQYAEEDFMEIRVLSIF